MFWCCEFLIVLLVFLFRICVVFIELFVCLMVVMVLLLKCCVVFGVSSRLSWVEILFLFGCL